jgi:hypothetical protein
MPDEEFDRLAVQRDAALIHALATRTVPPLDIDLDDPVVTSLVAWVDWIDAGVNEAEVFELAEHKDRVVAKGGKRHRAALIAGSTVAALVVTSGAAAAVSGDPFLVAKAPFTVIEKINPFDTDGGAGERLPDRASEVAKANELLADARRAMANGDTAEAERLMAEATAALGDSANPGQQNRIDKLVADIDSGGQNPGSGGGHPSGGPGGGAEPDTGKPDNGKPDNGKPDNGKPDNGKPDKNPGPVDKDPVDKDPNSDKGQDKDPVDQDPQGGSNNGSKTAPGDNGGQGSGQSDGDSRGPKGDKGSGKSGRNDSGDKGSGGQGSGNDKPDKDTGKPDKG